MWNLEDDATKIPVDPYLQYEDMIAGSDQHTLLHDAQYISTNAMSTFQVPGTGFLTRMQFDIKLDEQLGVAVGSQSRRVVPHRELTFFIRGTHRMEENLARIGFVVETCEVDSTSGLWLCTNKDIGSSLMAAR